MGRRIYQKSSPDAGKADLYLHDEAALHLSPESGSEKKITLVLSKRLSFNDFIQILRLYRLAYHKKMRFLLIHPVKKKKTRELDYHNFGKKELEEKEISLLRYIILQNILTPIKSVILIVPVIMLRAYYALHLAWMVLNGLFGKTRQENPEPDTIKALVDYYGVVSGIHNYVALQWWRAVENRHLTDRKILEVGIWDGVNSSIVFKNGCSAGIEYVQSQYDQAKNSGKYARYDKTWNTSIYDAPRVVQDRYDVVIALNTMHYIQEIDRALEAVLQLLRPGGLFIINTLGNYGALVRAGIISESVKDRLKWKFSFHFTPDTDELKQLMQKHGFEVISIDERCRGRNAYNFINLQQIIRNKIYQTVYKTVFYTHRQSIPLLDACLKFFDNAWDSSRIKVHVLTAILRYYNKNEFAFSLSPGLSLFAVARKPLSA